VLKHYELYDPNERMLVVGMDLVYVELIKAIEEMEVIKDNNDDKSGP
jgi:hypothetical protein